MSTEQTVDYDAGLIRLTDDECLRIVQASIAPGRLLSGQDGDDGHMSDVLLTTVREILTTRVIPSGSGVAQ